MSRVGEATGLDRLALPTFFAIRPRAPSGVLHVYGGKGATRRTAARSAAAEAIERWSAEAAPGPLILAHPIELCGRANVHPGRLLPAERVHPDQSWEWLQGRDLLQSGAQVLVPAAAVIHPYTPAGGVPRLGPSHSSGLAAGATMAAASLAGVLEVIERDAWSIAEMRGVAGRRALLSDPPSSIRRRLSAFSDAGVSVQLRDLTTDIGVPVFAAPTRDPDFDDSVWNLVGFGCHPSPAQAICRALDEAALGRAAVAQGARDDVPDWFAVSRHHGAERRAWTDFWWADDPTTTVDLKFAVREEEEALLLRWVLRRLRAAGLTQVAVVDLTRPGSVLYVVRVVIPGAEIACLDPCRAGPRSCRAQWT